MTKTFISRWTTHLCSRRDRQGTETDWATNQSLIVVPPKRAGDVALPWDRILSSACAALVMTVKGPHWRPVHRPAPSRTTTALSTLGASVPLRIACPSDPGHAQL